MTKKYLLTSQPCGLQQRAKILQYIFTVNLRERADNSRERFSHASTDTSGNIFKDTRFFFLKISDWLNVVTHYLITHFTMRSLKNTTGKILAYLDIAMSYTYQVTKK